MYFIILCGEYILSILPDLEFSRLESLSRDVLRPCLGLGLDHQSRCSCVTVIVWRIVSSAFRILMTPDWGNCLETFWVSVSANLTMSLKFSSGRSLLPWQQAVLVLNASLSTLLVHLERKAMKKASLFHIAQCFIMARACYTVVTICRYFAFNCQHRFRSATSVTITGAKSR